MLNFTSKEKHLHTTTRLASTQVLSQIPSPSRHRQLQSYRCYSRQPVVMLKTRCKRDMRTVFVRFKYFQYARHSAQVVSVVVSTPYSFVAVWECFSLRIESVKNAHNSFTHHTLLPSFSTFGTNVRFSFSTLSSNWCASRGTSCVQIMQANARTTHERWKTCTIDHSSNVESIMNNFLCCLTVIETICTLATNPKTWKLSCNNFPRLFLYVHASERE